jgi:cell division transport system permease protein
MGAGCMSMTEQTLEAEHLDDADESAAASPEVALPSFQTPIVPASNIAGRALMAVVAIMTFLASVTAGAVMSVRSAANDWQSEVAREVTIQVRPLAGRDVDAEVSRAAAIAQTFPGVAAVDPYSKEESGRLLEPWLGIGISLADLPVPRLILVRIAPGAVPDFARLRMLLAAVPSASLDDHRGFLDRMRTMAGSAAAVGFIVLVLVLIATVLSVTFATHAAIAINRPVIEVLHFVGAKKSFIAGNFQRHFLALGLKGGAIGGGSALALFWLAEFVGPRLFGGATGDEATALFGTFSIGIAGYVMMLTQVALIAGLTAMTSRYAVNRMIETIE